MKTIKDIAEKYHTHIFIPCSESEINIIEDTLQIKLPQKYREFLLLMGHGFYPYWQGEDYEVSELVELQGYACELLKRNSVSCLENIFVFWVSQGYQFCFFFLREEDPAIYYYNECDSENTYVKVSEDFYSFIYEGIPSADNRILHRILIK